MFVEPIQALFRRSPFLAHDGQIDFSCAFVVVGVGDRIIGAGVGPATWNVGKTSAERDAPDGSGQVKLIKFY